MTDALTPEEQAEVERRHAEATRIFAAYDEGAVGELRMQPIGQAEETPATLTAEELVEQLRALADLAEKASPGPWEPNFVESDGYYGMGEDTHEGFKSSAVFDSSGKQLCDALNADVGEVHEEYDEEFHSAWDDIAKRNMEFIAASRAASYREAADMLHAQAAEIERLTGLAAKAKKLKRCKSCGTARQGDTCWKCGSTLFEAHPDWEEPELPAIEPIRTAAREVGYAIGVHGSLERDLDLIAAPWTDDAIPALDLLKHIAARINARIVMTEAKPGRACAATLSIDGWFKAIDISVCCRRSAAEARAVAAEAKVAELEKAAKAVWEAWEQPEMNVTYDIYQAMRELRDVL